MTWSIFHIIFKNKVRQITACTYAGLKQSIIVYAVLSTVPAIFCALQEVLHERVKAYKNWKDAEATLTKKREAKAKLELAHKTDKISQAQQEITDVSRHGRSVLCQWCGFRHRNIFSFLFLNVCCAMCQGNVLHKTNNQVF